MRKILVLLMFITSFLGTSAQYLHHEVHARINHSTNEILVIDTITFPSGFLTENAQIIFELNKNLSLQGSDQDFIIKELELTKNSKSNSYSLTFSSKNAGVLKIPVHYSGKIEEAIVSGAAEYARGFSQTDGIISPEGIFLAGSTGWIPSMKEAELFTFNLKVDLDEKWNLVSQGTRSGNKIVNGRRIVQYSSPDPMDEIYLIAGEWTE